MRAGWSFFWAAACSAPTVTVDAVPTDVGVEIRAGAPIAAVRWSDEAGLVEYRVLPVAVPTVLLPGPWVPGSRARLRVELASGDTHDLSIAAPDASGPAAVSLQIPAGSPGRGVPDGAVVDVPRIGSASVPVALVARSRAPGALTVRVGDVVERADVVPGRRVVVRARVDGPTTASIEHDDGSRWQAELRPAVIPRAQAASALTMVSTPFPADRNGAPDRARADGRLILPAAWWSAAVRWMPGLGFRPDDIEIPRAHQGITLRNQGSHDLDVVVRLRVLGADDLPSPAFRPRARDLADPTGAVSVLLRVPAGGEATTAIPVWVDDDQLASGSPLVRELSVAGVGDPEPLHVARLPLVARRSGPAVTAVAAVAVLAALLGITGLLIPGMRGLRKTSTRDLVTISIFASLLFVVGAAGQVIGLAVAAVLGPFGPFLTGVVDEALSTALLATLITLVPRRGTAALAVVIGWLLRGLVLGGFSVVDVLFVGSQVFWLELFLALSGLTVGSTAWRDGSAFVRWLRLSIGLGGASVAAMACGLALQVVLYRLWLAPWYVAALLVGPAFLYVIVAVALAVPFADSLRRVEG